MKNEMLRKEEEEEEGRDERRRRRRNRNRRNAPPQQGVMQNHMRGVNNPMMNPMMMFPMQNFQQQPMRQMTMQQININHSSRTWVDGCHDWVKMEHIGMKAKWKQKLLILKFLHSLK